MNPRCWNCKKWRRNTDDYRNLDYGKCFHSKLCNGHYINQLEYPIDGLVFWQGNAQYAVMETGAGFCCIHHTPLPGGITK